MSAPRIPQRPVDWVRRIGTAAVVIIVVWSLLDLEIRWERLIDLPRDMAILAGLMFSNMPLERIPSLLGALRESVSIAWLGTILAALVAIPL